MPPPCLACHACGLQEVFVTSDYRYACIVTEFVSGGDIANYLEKHVASRKASPELALHLFRQLVSIVCHAHSKGAAGSFSPPCSLAWKGVSLPASCLPDYRFVPYLLFVLQRS